MSVYSGVCVGRGRREKKKMSQEGEEGKRGDWGGKEKKKQISAIRRKRVRGIGRVGPRGDILRSDEFMIVIVTVVHLVVISRVLSFPFPSINLSYPILPRILF